MPKTPSPTEPTPPVNLDPQAAQEIAAAIGRIDTAMQAVLKAGLTFRALVVLIQAESRLTRHQIESVLTSLSHLRRLYLQAKPSEGKKP